MAQSNKRKPNVRLLRKIQKHILAEPLRLDMMNFASTTVNEAFNPPCGTTGCIAGWCLILNGSKANTVANMHMSKLVDKASKLLGLDYTYAEHCGYMQHWANNATTNGENSANLFLVEEWPDKFRLKYEGLNEDARDLRFCETLDAEAKRKRAISIQKRLARVTSDRIDHFIKTGE